MNFRYSTLVAVIFLLLATPTAVQAKQFTKLLQRGQIVPGNDQVVTSIVEPTIGADGQVAVLIITNRVATTPEQIGPAAISKEFRGIYSISRNGQIRLVEGGIRTDALRLTTREEFSAPSISEGKIAYLAMKQSESGAISARDTKLRVGTPGAVKTILSLRLSNALAVYGTPNLAFVNGKAYFLDDLFANGDSGNGKIAGVVGLVNTLSPTPSVVRLRSNAANELIRASAKLLLISAPDNSPNADLLESSGDANFSAIRLFDNNTTRRDLSVSLDNVVSTSLGSASSVVSVRFGKQGKFVPLPPPQNSDTRYVYNPSISDRNVIYLSFGPVPRSFPLSENIYLSKNGQTPISLVGRGDILDGKTVSRLGLSRNGRTIAGNSAVFTASFTDGTTALYRVDF